MDGVEQAIRNALAKGKAESRAFRERVYLSAMSALEKSIAAHSDAAPEAGERRRKALRDVIRRIETEFLPAVETPGETRSAPPPHQPPEQPQVPPVRRPEPAEAAMQETETDFVAELRPPQGDQVAGEDGAERRRIFSRRRRPFTWLLVSALVLSSIGIGIWWIVSSGLLLSQAERDGSVPNPPPVLQGDDFVPADQSTANGFADGITGDGNWITIFTPDDPTTAVAPGGTTVSVVDEGTISVLRIQPSSTDSAVLFDVGQGALEQMAGKRVIFDIVAKTGEEQGTQMSIRCNFAELGDCGRKRYDVETAPNEFLFEIELPDRAPGSAGSIALTPDISAGKASVDILSIKVFVPN